jgi:hypothetical protein
MGALLQALEIIFQVQRKKNNEKLTRKKKAFQLIKRIFFLFEPLLLSNLITFLSILNDLKCYRNVT